MNWKKVFIFIVLLFIPAKAIMVDDPLHGFSVNLPDEYIIEASSKTGKIIINHKTFKKNISIFSLKNPKTKDDTYLLKVLSIPFQKYGFNVLYKKEKNKLIAVVEAPYWAFFHLFDSNYVQNVSIRQMANVNVKGLITMVEGKKYSFFTVMVYQDKNDLKELKSIVKSLKFKKPSIKYKNISINSTLFRIPAFYVDLPLDYRITNSFYFPRGAGEMPAILIEGKDGNIFLGILIYNYVYSPNLLAPMAMSTYIDFRTGQEVVMQGILQSDEEVIKFFVNQITGRQDFSAKLVFQEINPLTKLPTYYYKIESPNLLGEVLINKAEAVMEYSRGGSYSLFFSCVWGQNLNKAYGTLISLEMNPEWFSKNLKITIEEAKKEIEHQKWMWNEFRKTTDYINKLHNQEIKEEQIYQEEMARAMTNILSDYTYARDSETGEVFHLKDEFDQYWRTEEGEIFGVSGNIDERALEAEGFKKLQIRLEGFGQW